jgi:hypothetical protein
MAGLLSEEPSIYGEKVMTAYEPTLRDRVAAWMIGDKPASPERRNFVQGLLGSVGLGHNQTGVVDITPYANAPFGVDENVRDGNYKGALLYGLSGIPGFWTKGSKASSMSTGLLYPAQQRLANTVPGIIASGVRSLTGLDTLNSQEGEGNE